MSSQVNYNSRKRHRALLRCRVVQPVPWPKPDISEDNHCGWEFANGCLCLKMSGDSRCGRVAQLGEHLLCKQGVRGSNPLTSTNLTTFDSATSPKISCRVSSEKLGAHGAITFGSSKPNPTCSASAMGRLGLETGNDSRTVFHHLLPDHDGATTVDEVLGLQSQGF
jgi:hypothetical protein